MYRPLSYPLRSLCNLALWEYGFYLVLQEHLKKWLCRDEKQVGNNKKVKRMQNCRVWQFSALKNFPENIRRREGRENWIVFNTLVAQKL